MDQPEEILEKLERFNVQKNPEITRELDEYVSFVARTGESVFNWALVKKLYREKLINVITEFYNEQPTKELPQYPNVDPFNYETMKKMLIERLDSFNAAPFTIQRISELLADPRKQYSRIDKFMRAVEKNILVVSTVSPPSRNRSEESENGDSLDSVGLNGDFSTDVNVDIDMENDGGSFTMTKEFNATTHRKEANHEIVTETQETVTIKKTASKEEEATTSTIARNISNGEALHPTQTDIKIETHSTVTITPCEHDSKAVSEENSDKTDENMEQKTEDTVIKSDVQHEPITLLTENVEPKIDDALLNEPLRPVDDEILPENLETTPLAALENIVASRVEVVVETPRIEEPIAMKQDEMVEEPTKIQVEEQQTLVVETEQKEQKLEEISENDSAVDDSGIEAKRIRIEEVEVAPETTNIQADKQVEPESAPESKMIEDNTLIAAVVEEPMKEQSQTKEPQEEGTEKNLSENIVEDSDISEPSEVAAEPIIEEEKKIEDIPIAAEPIIETVTKEPEVIVPIETAEQQPEPIPEIEPIVENTMALDEDIPAVPTAAQIPEIPQPATEMESATNKMDTDETEAENVQMDTDENEEPMDQ